MAMHPLPFGPMPIPPPDPEPRNDPPRRCCGNCMFAEPKDGDTITCRFDARGFANHPVPDQVFPRSRGGCLHHQYTKETK